MYLNERTEERLDLVPGWCTACPLLLRRRWLRCKEQISLCIMCKWPVKFLLYWLNTMAKCVIAVKRWDRLLSVVFSGFFHLMLIFFYEKLKPFSSASFMSCDSVTVDRLYHSSGLLRHFSFFKESSVPSLKGKAADFKFVKFTVTAYYYSYCTLLLVLNYNSGVL